MDHAHQVDEYPQLVNTLIYWIFDDYEQAHQLLDNALQEAVTSGQPDVEFLVMVIRGVLYHHQGRIDPFLDCFEQAELLHSINELEQMTYQRLWFALFYRLSALVYFENQQFTLAAESIAVALSYLDDRDYKIIREWILYDSGKIYREMNKHNQALSYFHELLCDLPDTNLRRQIYQEMGEIHQNQGNLNIALYYLNLILNLDQSVNLETIPIYSKIASIFLSKGMYDNAVATITLSQEQYKERGDVKGEIWSTFHLAISHFRKGNWNQSLELFKECQDRMSDHPDPSLEGLILKFIGDINRLKGDLDDARDNFNQSITIFSELKDRWNLADVYNKLGQVYFQERETQKAHQSFQKSLAIFRKIGDFVRYSEPIFNLIRTRLELDTLDQAKTFLDMLRTVSKRTDDQLVQQREKMATALYLKNQHRIVQKVQSQEILMEIVNDDIIDAELTILGMVNLCDLLLAELHLYQQQEVLEEIMELSDRLVNISVEQRSDQIQVEALILKARLSLIAGEIDKSSKLFEQAKELADEASLTLHLDRIREEQEKLADQIREWEVLNAKSSSIREKLELLQIHRYIDNILATR